MRRIQHRTKRRGVETHPRLVDHQVDAVEVGLQPRLHDQARVHRLPQRVVSRDHRRRLLRGHGVGADDLAVHGARGGGPAAVVHGHAVEDLQDRDDPVELRPQRRIPAAIDHKPPRLLPRRFDRKTIRHRLGRGPAPQQFVQAGLLRRPRAAARKGLHRTDQRLRLRGRQAHGLAQVAHHARAAHLGQAAGRLGQRHGIGELAVEGVERQVEVGRLGADRDAVHLGGAAVAARHGRAAGDDVAVAQVRGSAAGREADAGDVALGQGEELAGLADAVLVEVLPQAHLAEGGVAGVEDAVGIARRAGRSSARVQRAQRLEAVARHALGAVGVGDQGVDAEQFAAGVDQAVAVAVERQPGVVAAHPAGARADAVGVVVEEDRGGPDTHGLQAVAVEVDGERVAGGAGWGEGGAPRRRDGVGSVLKRCPARDRPPFGIPYARKILWMGKSIRQPPRSDHNRWDLDFYTSVLNSIPDPRRTVPSTSRIINSSTVQ